MPYDLNLDYNQLSRFDSNVFQPLLEAGGTVNIYSSECIILYIRSTQHACLYTILFSKHVNYLITFMNRSNKLRLSHRLAH